MPPKRSAIEALDEDDLLTTFRHAQEQLLKKPRLEVIQPPPVVAKRGQSRKRKVIREEDVGLKPAAKQARRGASAKRGRSASVGRRSINGYDEDDNEDGEDAAATSSRPASSGARPALRGKITREPNSVVSLMVMTNERNNCIEMETINWPNIELDLPCLHEGHQGLARCEVCFKMYELVASWYQAHPEKLTLREQTTETTLADQSNRADPRTHEHDILINGTHKLDLPELVEKVKRGPRKTKKQKMEEAAAAEAAELARQEAMDEDSDPTLADAAERVFGARENPLVKQVVKEDVHKHNQKEQAVVPAKVKKALLPAAAAGGLLTSQIDTWVKLTIKYLRDEFVTESTLGRIDPPKYELKPWPHQVRMSEHIADTYDWEAEEAAVDAGEKPNERFLVYWEQGSGKTDGILFPWQANPPKRVVYVVGNTVIRYWANKIAEYPQSSGSTIHEVLGYAEFARRIKEEPLYLRGAVLVVDEAHSYRRVTTAMVPVLEAFAFAVAVFNLTGTPLMNQQDDWTGMKMYMGLCPVVDMADIRNDPELQELYALPKRGVDYKRLYEQLKGKVFYYRPEIPIPTQRIDIRTPISWHQAVEYWFTNKQRPTLGRLRFSTSHRNSFESLSRRVSNCILDPRDPSRVLVSPKFDAVVEYIRVAEEKRRLFNDRSDLPIVIYSQYLKRGIFAVYNQLRKQEWAKNLRIAIVSKDCSADERDRLREAFNRGEIDIMFLSPVCKQSYDLLDCSAIILLEVPDSQGAEGQILSRILRSAAERRRPDMVVKLIRMVAVFPEEEPNDEDRATIWDFVCQVSKLSREALESDTLKGKKVQPVDAVAHLQEEIDEIGVTADEIRVQRNIDKFSKLYRMDLVLKGASIDLGDVPSKFSEELELLFADRLADIGA